MTSKKEGDARPQQNPENPQKHNKKQEREYREQKEGKRKKPPAHKSGKEAEKELDKIFKKTGKKP